MRKRIGIINLRILTQCILILSPIIMNLRGRHVTAQKLWVHKVFYTDPNCSKSTFWNYDGYNITTNCVRIFPSDSSEYLSINAETLETALCSTATCEPAKCTKITPKTLYDLSSYVECTRAGNSSAGFQWAKIQYSSVSTPWPNVAQAQQRVFLGPNCTGSISSTSGFPTGVCIPNPVAERPGSALYGIATCAPNEVGATASLNPDCSDPYISSSTPITCWSSVSYFCAADLSLIVNWAALSANSIAEISPATFALASAQDLMSISVEVIPFLSRRQIENINFDALSGFTAAQVSKFSFAKGSDSPCAAIPIGGLINGIQGITPGCVAVISAAAWENITALMLQRIPPASFSKISKYSNLLPTVFAGATLDQLSSISWVAPIAAPNLLTAIEVHKLDILSSWTRIQLGFWSGDAATTQNVDTLVRICLHHFDNPNLILNNTDLMKTPQEWTYLHVMLITAPQPSTFWLPILSSAQPQVLSGLQRNQVLGNSFFESMTAEQAQYILPGYASSWTLAQWSLVPPFAIQGFSSSVYQVFPASGAFNVTQIACLSPSKVSFVDCSILPTLLDPLNAKPKSWNWIRLDLVSELRAIVQSCGVNFYIPSNTSAGPLIIPPPFIDNQYTWNTSQEANPNTSNDPPNLSSPEMNSSAPGQRSSQGPWETVTFVLIGVGIVLAIVVVALVLRVRHISNRGGSQRKRERQPLLAAVPSIQTGTAFSLWDKAVMLERLGIGGSGAEVFRCSVQGLTCAAKVLNFQDAFNSSIEEFSNEVDVLIEASQRTDWVVKYLHHTYNPVSHNFVLFMEFLPGTLQSQISLMRQNKTARFSAKTISKIGHGILSGLIALHNYSREDAATAGMSAERAPGQRPIIHRDLKPGNVFAAFNQFGDVVSLKLGDFGISKLVSVTTQARTAMMGTMGYMAPEVLNAADTDAAYTTAADMYSFGMLLFEILTLQPPYADVRSDSERHRRVSSGIAPDIPNEVQEERDYQEFLSVFKECVHAQPTKRPTAIQLLRRKTFSNWHQN